MNRRPMTLNILTVIFVAIALSLPIQALFLNPYGLNSSAAALNKISMLNLLMASCLLLTSYLIFKASSLVLVALPASILVVTWNNLVVSSYGMDFAHWQTTLASLLFVAICAPILQKNILKLFQNQNNRWWLRPKRKKTNLQTVLLPFVGEDILTQLFDLSETGTFIAYQSCTDKKHNPKQPILKVGDLTCLSIQVTPCDVIKCQARVVRTADSTGQYPAGMGLQFINMNFQTKRHLRRIVNTAGT